MHTWWILETRQKKLIQKSKNKSIFRILWKISLDGTWTYVAQEVEPEKEKIATPVLEDAESLLYRIEDLGLVIKMLYASASV